MLDAREKEILNFKFPENPDEETDYLLTMQSVLSSPEFLEELERERTKETHPMLIEAKEKLKMSIDAASGMRKIIEQLHSSNAVVKIDNHEKNVKRAVRNIFKTDKDEITFPMYKQAIERTRAIAERMKERIIDEQTK